MLGAESVFIKNDERLVEGARMVAVRRDWNIEARRLLKREMASAGVGYEELSAALLLQGLNLSAKVLANKVNRGTFTLAFFLQCMSILKVDQVRLADLR